MKKVIFLVMFFMFLIGACIPVPASLPSPSATSLSPTQTASATASSSPLPPTSTPTDTLEPTPTDTPTPLPALTISFPPSTVLPAPTTPRPPDQTTASQTPTPTVTATLACERETASLRLSAPVERLKVGETVKVSVTLTNEGCVALGLPQYRLYIQSSGSQPMFAPEGLQPVVHGLAVGPGQSDTAEFNLTAAGEGQATLTATVSYEVHLGYPGPAYWGSTASPPLTITVLP